MIATYAAIGAGGAIGAMLRHGMNAGVLRVMGSGFPYGILAINILGCFVMGVVIALFVQIWEPPVYIKSFVTTGILGGFTTFSAFSLDAVMLWERGEMLAAVVYVLLSVGLSIAGLVLGLSLVRGVFA